MEDHFTHRFTACNNSVDLWDTGAASPLSLNGTYGDYLYVGRAVESIRNHNAEGDTPLFFYLAL